MVTHHPRTPQPGPPCEQPERRAGVTYTPAVHRVLHAVHSGQVQYLDPGVLVVHGDAPDDDTYHALSALCFDGLIEAAHEPDEAGLRPMGLTDHGAETLSRWRMDRFHEIRRRAEEPVPTDAQDFAAHVADALSDRKWLIGEVRRLRKALERTNADPEHPTTGGPR